MHQIPDVRLQSGILGEFDPTGSVLSRSRAGLRGEGGRWVHLIGQAACLFFPFRPSACVRVRATARGGGGDRRRALRGYYRERNEKVSRGR